MKPLYLIFRNFYCWYHNHFHISCNKRS